MTINVDIVPRANEPFEKTLRRFTKKCKKEQIARQLAERSYFVSEREKRRAQKAAKRKKLEKKRAKQQKYAFE